MVWTHENGEPESRRQPSIPEKTSEIRQPRQKAQLHRPVRRSRSIPRDNQENVRRRARDFGESSATSGKADRNQINRHSFDALSVEHSQDFTPRGESCDASQVASVNLADYRRPNTRTTESREMQVL